MNLNEQLTEIVLERVDTSTKELSNNASKQLRKRNLDEEFIPQATLEALKEQTRSKLKILNQSFRYSNSYDKLIKLKEDGEIIKSTYRPSGNAEADMRLHRLDAKLAIKKRLKSELAEVKYINEQLLNGRKEACQNMTRRMRQSKAVQDDTTCRDKKAESSILAVVN